MHEAAKVGAWAIAEVLSRWGSELSHMDNRGMTPLGYAAEAGHSKTCEKLIALGAKASGKGNFDIISVHFSRIFTLHHVTRCRVTCSRY